MDIHTCKPTWFSPFLFRSKEMLFLHPRRQRCGASVGLSKMSKNDDLIRGVPTSYPQGLVNVPVEHHPTVGHISSPTNICFGDVKQIPNDRIYRDIFTSPCTSVSYPNLNLESGHELQHLEPNLVLNLI